MRDTGLIELDLHGGPIVVVAETSAVCVDDVPQGFLATDFTPEVDGYEVSTKLREAVQCPSIIVGPAQLGLTQLTAPKREPTWRRMLTRSEVRAILSLEYFENHDLAATEAESEQFFFANPNAMALLSPNQTLLRINPQMAEIIGLDPEDHIGKNMGDIVPDLMDQISSVFEGVLRTGQPILAHRIEGVTAARVDERRLFLTDWFPVRINTEIVAVGVNFRDITEQSETQTDLRRRMLELRHREKNMLANVLALVSRARREAVEDASVMDTLAARINALSQTNKRLTQNILRATDICALIRSELTEVYGSERIHLAGPQFVLNARAVVALGMSIHELAANAAKYGAFSRGGGMVSLTWMRMDDGEAERVAFQWVESGGPKVGAQRGVGFGSQLIVSTITGSLDGTIETNWLSSGLVVNFSILYETLRDMKEDAAHDVF